MHMDSNRSGLNLFKKRENKCTQKIGVGNRFILILIITLQPDIKQTQKNLIENCEYRTGLCQK